MHETNNTNSFSLNVPNVNIPTIKLMMMIAHNEDYRELNPIRCDENA